MLTLEITQEQMGTHPRGWGWMLRALMDAPPVTEDKHGRTMPAGQRWVGIIGMLCVLERREYITLKEARGLYEQMALLYPYESRELRRCGRTYDTKRPKWRRDAFITWCLMSLEGCGLPPTSKNGDSLAKVLAQAIDVGYHAIATAWKEAPERKKKGSRQRTIKCPDCGPIPTYQAQRCRCGKFT